MSPIDREEAARRAAEELLKPDYEKEPLLDLLYRRFNQFLGDLVDAATGGGPVGGIIAAALIVLIIVGVIVLISWQLRKTARRNAAAVGGLFGERAMSAAEHRQAAERLAVQERWGEALQERLRAIARDLEERALVDGMPGRTADELAAEAAVSLPGFATQLAAAARSFDDVTYGGVPGTRETYEAMAHLDDQLRQARPVPLSTPSGVPAVGVPVGVGAPAGAGAPSPGVAAPASADVLPTMPAPRSGPVGEGPASQAAVPSEAAPDQGAEGQGSAAAGRSADGQGEAAQAHDAADEAQGRRASESDGGVS
ncbi:DUF4129 domain-containing protein [Nonomuraea turkmeniaca]|uniref:DUF4129 domain-containing protein n=1 Tax=Nonomuraea turkmeniaca TaxID=103838 RepID=UPI001B86752A|nr:DUF4129 domain-containing protein [Nonomuraea turkmeniaca]